MHQPEINWNMEAQRFTTLDGMRGIAAVAVMAHHFTRHTSMTIFWGADIAVDLFFCLSGFVITHSYLSRLEHSMSLGEFFLRRLVRLYPMYLMGMLLGAGALLLKVANGQSSLDYFRAAIAILANTFYLPYLSSFFVEIGNEKIASVIFPTNDPYWSLFFELVVNILFGAIILQRQRFSIWGLTLLGMIGLLSWVMLTSSAAPGWGTENIIGGIPRVLFGFFSGVSAFLFYRKYKLSIPVINPAYLLILIAIVMFQHWPAYAWLACMIAMVPSLVLLGSVATPKTHRQNKCFEYLGWISYPVYCLHFPVYSLFTLLTDNADYGLWASAICIPIVIALTHVLTRRMEEPLREMLSRRFFGRQPSSA